MSVSLIFVLAALAMIAVPLAHGVEGATDLTVTKVDVTRTTTQASGLRVPATQAGGHPDVGIMFQLCGQGVPIDSASNTAPIRITTSQPVSIPGGGASALVRGAQGNVAANGFWRLNTVGTDGKTFDLLATDGRASDPYVPGSAKLRAAEATGPVFGCTPQQSAAYLKDFTLRLPPGFLGNPTATVACPELLWVALTCPPESIVGWSWAPLIQVGVREDINKSARTPVYNVETLGLEPARLGTADFPADPSGPFPVAISVRTTGDRGLDSSVINIPTNLSGFFGYVIEINTVLCGRVPTCDRIDTPDAANNWVTHDSDPATTRPFFVNPTSCAPKTLGAEARSWKSGAVTSSLTTQMTSTGCENVPFDLDFDVDPSAPENGGTTEAGQPSAQDVVLEYPREATCPARSVEPDCWYENEDIWQAQLKDITQSLPQGLALSPGGGVGLEGCTYEQFGVNAQGEQVNDEPVACPAGSQIGSLTVRSPVIPTPVGGKVFFGPTSGPGRATAERPWKIFLLIEGVGLRIKLAGDVIVAEDGTVSNVFVDQPELPFGELRLRLEGGPTAPLMNPDTCGTHEGSATLTGWNSVPDASHPNATNEATPSLTTTARGEPGGNPDSEACRAPVPFNPTVPEATATPKQAGANSVSRIVITRPDGDQNIRNIKLSLPAGAVGSLAAVPMCQLPDARAGNCPADSRVGTVKNTVGNGDGLLTAEGGLFLGEASQPGDAASIIIDVPAKAGPIDLGDVILISRVVLRQSDTGVDVFTNDIPKLFGGVPLPLRRIEITVDRPGFFLNPTGCENRPLIATFDAYEGAQSVSSVDEIAEGCDKLPFNPKLRLIAGAPGLTKKGSHPPLTAILTQEPGEANIRQAKVVLPDILRPNVPEFNEPGGLCAEADFVVRNCPAGSLVGDARVITPVLPFELAGPVYLVQETVDPLPRLFVLLRGGGFEVPLKARNFFEGIKVVNLFETVPDVPQSYFQLNVHGGPDGILNAFFDMCKASPRPFDTRFTGHNGKTVVAKPLLEVTGCGDLRAASIRSRQVRVKGRTARVRVSCRLDKTCKGRLTLRTVRKVLTSKKSRKKARVTYGSGSINIPARKSRIVKVKLTSKGMRVLKLRLRSRVTATAKITGERNINARLTLVAPHGR